MRIGARGAGIALASASLILAGSLPALAQSPAADGSGGGFFRPLGAHPGVAPDRANLIECSP